MCRYMQTFMGYLFFIYLFIICIIIFVYWESYNARWTQYVVLELGLADMRNCVI